MIDDKLIENPEFYKNLDWAYAEIERRVNESTIVIFDKIPKKDWMICLTYPFDFSKTNIPNLDKLKIARCLCSRVSIRLGNNYLLKSQVSRVKNSYGLFTNPVQLEMTKDNEETSMKILRKYGLTKNNNFWIPEHKVVGLKFEGDEIKVDPNGYGLTITEDASEKGSYSIENIESWQFVGLNNHEEYFNLFKKHIIALEEICTKPEIKASICRHHSLNIQKAPFSALTRMLLAKIKDNIGEIFIGDLDNVCFEEKEK